MKWIIAALIAWFLYMLANETPVAGQSALATFLQNIGESGNAGTIGQPSPTNGAALDAAAGLNNGNCGCGGNNGMPSTIYSAPVSSGLYQYLVPTGGGTGTKIISSNTPLITTNSRVPYNTAALQAAGLS